MCSITALVTGVAAGAGPAMGSAVLLVAVVVGEVVGRVSFGRGGTGITRGSRADPKLTPPSMFSSRDFLDTARTCLSSWVRAGVPGRWIVARWMPRSGQ